MGRRPISALQGRALIVEDEYVVAVDLVAALKGLGFESCDRGECAGSAGGGHAESGRPGADGHHLGGGHEGIKAARWLREVCGAPVVFITSYADDLTVSRLL
jgi:hypothetical protein